MLFNEQLILFDYCWLHEKSAIYAKQENPAHSGTGCKERHSCCAFDIDACNRCRSFGSGAETLCDDRSNLHRFNKPHHKVGLVDLEDDA